MDQHPQGATQVGQERGPLSVRVRGMYDKERAAHRSDFAVMSSADLSKHDLLEG